MCLFSYNVVKSTFLSVNVISTKVLIEDTVCLLLETGPPFFAVIRATRISSRLQGKWNTFLFGYFIDKRFFFPQNRFSIALESLERLSTVLLSVLALFSASFQSFCLTVRLYLNTQKYRLFCSLFILRPWVLARSCPRESNPGPPVLQ